MLVERRREKMPVAPMARVVLAWLAISTILLLINLGAATNEPLAEFKGNLLVLPLLEPVIGRTAAEFIALAAMPLFALGVAMMLAARLSWKVTGTREALMTCLAMALSVPLLFQMGPQIGAFRVEQHGWPVVCALIAMNGFLGRRPHLGGWIVGLSLATWISISPEGWIYSGFVCAMAALKWLRNRADRMWLVYITQAMAVGSIAFFLGLNGLGDLATHCDRIGPVHIAMLCWTALVLSALSRVGPIPSGALLGGFLIAGGGAIGMLLIGAPTCAIAGTPLWQQELTTVLENIALPLIGIWAATQLAARNAGWLRRWWFDYNLLLVAVLAVTTCTSRGGAVAAALAAVPLGWQLRLWLDHSGQMKNPIKRMAALVLLAGVLMPTLALSLLALD